jgi:hypothetical protein
MSYVPVGAVNFLKVFVSNWLNNPISGANVTVFCHGTSFTYTLMTGQDGYVTFQLSNGVYDVWTDVGSNHLEATIYHDGTEATVNLQDSITVIVVDFLAWSPLLLPNWLWFFIIIMVCIAAWYIFKKSA